MSKLIAAGALALSLIGGSALAQQAPAAAPAAPAAAAPAAPAAPAAAPAGAAAKLTSGSTLGALVGSEKAKEVLKKHIPQVVEFIDGGGIDLVRDFTLVSLVDIPEAGITADTVKAIDADLAKL